MLCSLIGWAFFGLFVGAIARLLWPKRLSLGLLRTSLLGVVGSVVGGLITYLLTGGPHNDFEPSGYLMSIVGAILVLWFFGDGRPRIRP